MKKNWLSHVLLTALLVAGCNGKSGVNAGRDYSVPVIASKAARINAGKKISISGNIEGCKTVRIGFLVAGKINYIASNEGEFVKKDQLVASLDPAGYEIAKDLADIQVNQVQDEYDRLKIMYDNNSLSESDFARITYGLQQAKAQQRLHSKNLSDTRLYSPFSGVLLKKLCETGEITGAGMPLFVISDISRVKVSAFIPENELHNIKIGQEATVSVSSMSGPLKGKIVEIGSAADIASRSFSVRIELDNPQLLVRPGMIAEISIDAGNTDDIIAVPAQAVLHDYSNLSYVFVADTLYNRASRRNVSPGRLFDDLVEITAGLNENELVITGGQQKLIDGSPVIISK
ncbi:MAG TPA: efflux RND transporter periplasmic adaptor subunit [Bacteroidales bacterium]|jgi:RND family efflux transporter MFP subunit|nr:efflux RND transporter periplasmic adaptor subunit [Bacteroidales bacterium]